MNVEGMPESDRPRDSSLTTAGLGYRAARALMNDVLEINVAGRKHSADKARLDERGEALPAIPGYIIDSHLGGGGGGEVYLGVRAGSDRLLAVKVFRHDLSNSRAVERMKREIDLLERLRLDCVPRVIDHGLVNGRFYIATEFVDGEHVTRYCDGHGLELRGRVELLALICDCVQKLHDHGVLHRDLKPSNILIEEGIKAQRHQGIEQKQRSNSARSPHASVPECLDASVPIASDPFPMIIDFGIATMLHDSNDGEAHPRYHTITQENAAIGSPLYMSPEQARGERSNVTIQSDVYSLGALAYAVLLKGHTPHDATTAQSELEMLHRVGYEEPRVPRQLDPSIPKALDAVLRKATARERNERYRTASEFAEDLRRWLRREPVEAGMKSRWSRAVRAVGRHPIAATAGVCAVIVATTLVATYVTVWLINARPYDIKVTDDGRTARLLSYGGRILHEWDSERDYGIVGAELIREPSDLGGRLLALVAVNQMQQAKYAGGVYVYDVDEPMETPIAIWNVKDADMPKWLLDMGRTSDLMAPTRIEVEDVFADSPGPEAIVVFQLGPWSQCALRIYNLAGDLLYEVWHDGNITDVYWMSGPGVLVLAGLNAEAYWNQRGHPEVKFPHARVVFAIRPQIGQIANTWISPATAERAGALPWYRCMLPPEVSDHGAQIELSASRGSLDEADFCSVSIRFDNDSGPVVSWTIDGDGNEVPNTRVPSDPFRHDARLQALGEIYLGELPPVVVEPGAPGSPD